MNDSALQGKRILLVDDDPLVLQIYGRGLAQHGLEVTTASDGLLAMKALRTARPDAVVLDLMMPKFSGMEVLKFIRSEPGMAGLPVVVLSNAYMEEAGGSPVMAGAQKALLKFRSTPSVLVRALEEVLQSGGSGGVAPVAGPVAPKRPRPAVVLAASKQPAVAPPAPALSEAELLSKAREEFLRNAATTRAAMRSAFQAWSGATQQKELRLQDLHRRAHLLSTAAGLAQCHRLALLAGALEGLLFQVMDQPARSTASVRDTLTESLEYIETLFGQLNVALPDKPPSTRVLLVNANQGANRLLLSAFKQCGLQARGTEEPALAGQWLKTSAFDLLVLSVKLPGTTPGELVYGATPRAGGETMPVIYLSDDEKLESSAERIFAGQQVLEKTSLPMEVAVKAIMALLKSQAG